MSRTATPDDPKPLFTGAQAAAKLRMDEYWFRKKIRRSKVVPKVGKGRVYSLTVEQVYAVLQFAGVPLSFQAVSARLLS